MLYACMRAKSPQSFLILCDPMDCSPPGSFVRGILHVRILEWAAISSSRGSSQLRDPTSISCVSCIGRQVLYHEFHLGSPLVLCSQGHFPSWPFSNGRACCKQSCFWTEGGGCQVSLWMVGADTLRAFSKCENETQQLEKPQLLLERSKIALLYCHHPYPRPQGLNNR